MVHEFLDSRRASLGQPSAEEEEEEAAAKEEDEVVVIEAAASVQRWMWS